MFGGTLYGSLSQVNSKGQKINKVYRVDIKDSSVWIDNVSESQLIDLMNQIIFNNKDIKLYSLPKIDPKKTLELGVKGSSKNVDKAIKEIKSNLSKLNINWRDNT